MDGREPAAHRSHAAVPREPCRPGATIAVFFYDGPISRAVAFDACFDNGERFAERLVGAFSDGAGRAQLVHIATDGETYGHHHRHGDMALAYALALHRDARPRRR